MSRESLILSEKYTKTCIIATDTGCLTDLEQLIDQRLISTSCLVAMPLIDTTCSILSFVIAFGGKHSKKVAELLINKGAYVNTLDFEPLRFAVKIMKPDFVLMLLERGASLIYQDETINDRPLSPVEEALDRLFQCVQFSKTTRLPTTNDPLDLMRYFHELTIRNLGSPTTLDFAFDILLMILDHGIHILGENEREREFKKLFVLLKAIYMNNINIVSALIDDRNTNYFKVVKPIYGPIRFAMLLNRTSMIELFIDKNISIEEVFLNTCKKGNLELLKKCITKGIDINNTKSDTWMTAMHIVVAGTDAQTELQIIDLLLEERFNIINLLREKDGNGQTLWFHIQLTSVMKYFLNNFFYYFDSQQQDNNGNTLIHPELGEASCDLYKLLLQYGVDPNVPNSDGYYPTHECCNQKTVLVTDGHENVPICKVLEHFKKLYLLDPEYVKNKTLKLFLREYQFEGIDAKKKSTYEKEIQKMKKILISRPFMSLPAQNLHDFMFFQPAKTCRYSKNKIILRIYENTNYDFEKIFPHYGFILNYQLRRGMKMARLVKSFQNVIHSALGSEIPDAFSQVICQYLGEKKLMEICESAGLLS